MNHNPFTPPQTEVADPVRSMPPMPPAVFNACLLIAAAFVLGLVTLIPGVRVPLPDEQSMSLFATFMLIVVFGGLTAWLALNILRAKNWARWAMLALLAIGWLLVGTDFTAEFERSPLASMIDVACVAMELVACAWLFFGAGAQWFASMARTRR